MRRISPPDASWSYPSLMSVQISNDNFFELYYDFQEKQKLETPGFKEIDDKIFKYQLKKKYIQTCYYWYSKGKMCCKHKLTLETD